MSKKGKGKGKGEQGAAEQSVVLAPGISTLAQPEVSTAPSTALEVAGGSVSTAQAAAVLAPKVKVPYRHSAKDAPDNLLVLPGPTATKPGTVRAAIKQLAAEAGKPVTIGWLLAEGGKRQMGNNLWDQPRGKMSTMLAHGQLTAVGTQAEAPPADQPAQ